MTDHSDFRRRVLDMTDTEIDRLVNHVRGALEGDSNDAEHDALVDCAESFGIGYLIEDMSEEGDL